MQTIVFERVTPSNANLKGLFNLLQKRKYTISHLELPSFQEHTEFVINHPYRIWDLCLINDEIVGSYYITYQNSVGIDLGNCNRDILEEIVNHIYRNYKPVKEEKSIVPGYFYFNIPFLNNTILDDMKSLGFEPIQISLRRKKK